MSQEPKILVGLYGCSALIQLALGIVAVLFGASNIKEMCSDSFIHLSTWLLVQGIVMLFMVVGGPISKYCSGKSFYISMAIFYSLFELIWIIMGGVILWRDSLPCEDLDPEFYVASMVVVIISIILFCCGGMKTFHESDQS